MVISLFILCFASTLAFSSTNKEQQLEVLSDSISKKIGQKDFIPFYQEYMRLARQQNDTAKIDDAYSQIASHYYRLRNTDSLKVVAYEYMDWCLKRGNINNRYTQWRQYIQLLTEKGLQDEAMRETGLLQKDADAAKSAFGMACSEMCIGYNHRVFSNNVKLCLEYYSSALKKFSDAGFYEDAYVVSLNIIQTYLARGEYANAMEYLNCMPELIEKMKRKDIPVRPELTMRYYQFQVIATLALKGKKEAQPFIAETDKFYHENINAFPREGWLGYKILCARTLNDNQMALNYLDSLMDYHHSVGSCYPANHLLKAQFMEQMGRFEDACEVYKSYAHINDSIRSAELDEQLSKYTVQFEVDKLEHDKLELRAEVNRNLFITSVIVGCLVLILLIVITFYYMRSLSLNRKLDAANKAVIKASHMKSSFIQHITHEIRTPLNSIIGFSSLMAAGGLTQEEMEEYARQMESSNAYLLDLVNNVIDIADMDSQTDDIPKKPVSVDACCQECLGLIRQNLKEGIELQYMPSSAPVEVCTVEIWMKRVLLGLLNNANKFTETGFIRLSYEEDKPNRLVRFIIEDSGPGIDENYRDSIFERFAKVDAFTQGTGLGLSIIRQIMELVDGNVYLDTSYAGGARFVVEWPQ
ncbi:sensor histidine kinase [Bacteroides thetaiotaomicron]|uniref:sensor histidine kinase n=1 Tax=Bacteroides thetaiotaomicron TaxID=818 RepID=UPI001F45ADFD|nr:HAMP domain-containing sensor histidine kinase [Bacteroides thetaiotaomicron]MCE9079117.1 HAMP domain-containing histidine kinase [Bacteroides thetaiotaomicron]MCS2602607.1 HAMP domain-containing histidine kinase [Bacteroides thetaiotaomicron]